MCGRRIAILHRHLFAARRMTNSTKPINALSGRLSLPTVLKNMEGISLPFSFRSGSVEVLQAAATPIRSTSLLLLGCAVRLLRLVVRKTYDVSAASTPLASISLHCTRFQEHCNNNKKTNAIRTIAHDSVVVSFCSSSKPKCCGEWTGSVPCHGQCPHGQDVRPVGHYWHAK